jgi:CHASE2 domain-containing sensor protein/tRNA A-37 threonylcarbamoyl transferase component Bud32
MLGTLLHGRYKIIRVLGSGGFGKTYFAEDTQQPHGFKCVVKQFQPVRQDTLFLQTARRLFASEVESLRKLGSHDQIPTLIDNFEADQEFYLVQEYVEGRSLSQEFTKTRRLEESDVKALLQDTLQILEFVHTNQVIHRDIKPGNLMRRQQDGRFVLIDFGAVKEIQTQLTAEPGQTNLTIGIGTQGYAPSEQLMGKPVYSSDLYALGMTAIHALTGVQPTQLPTDPETGEVLWRDQVPVSEDLAIVLDRMVRYHFSRRYASATAVLHALSHPTERFAIDETRPMGQPPGYDSTQLPSYLVDRPPTPTPVLPPPRRGAVLVARFGLAGLMVAGLMGMRQLGWLQPLELAVFDRMVQLSPSPGPDPRLIVVGITEADIQAQKRFPLSDRTVAQLLKRVKSYQPKAIGLDLLRDLPQEPGNRELLAELKAPNVITIANIGNAETTPTPAPPGVPGDRVGFNDLVLDPDGVVRRNLLFADSKTETLHSFSLRLALLYLAPQGVVLKSDSQDPDLIHLGKANLRPLDSTSGGYQTNDARGYQLLLKYRSRTIARQVSLTAVLNGQVRSDEFKDKIVLIGTTAPNVKDVFFTPYSAVEPETAKLAGVLVHAQALSQLLDAAMGDRSLFGFWAEWVEVVWIVGWGAMGGVLAGRVQRPVVLGLGGVMLLGVLLSTGFGLFLMQIWVPIVAPALTATAAGGVVLAQRAYSKR